jgi:hypothetical protein
MTTQIGHKPRLGLTLVAYDLMLQLVEECYSANGTDTTYSFFINGNKSRQLEFPAGYPPGIAIHPPFLFIWGAAQLYWGEVKNGSCELQELEYDDEIRAIFPINGEWCIISETEVRKMDSMLNRTSKQYYHNEVITRFWRENHFLVVEDFEGTVLSFDFSRNGGELIPTRHVARNR